MHFIRNILALGLLFTILNISSSPAKVGRKTPSRDGEESAGPYYNPASKSYFELFKLTFSGEFKTWETAKRYAEKKQFKKTSGRLALVKNAATHDFIIKHFKAKYFWIGLQYFCRSQTLRWIDGTIVSKADFSAWTTPWARHPSYRCGNKAYMPVFYTSYTPTRSLMWQASGPGKEYLMYLVEYPTGKK